MNFDLRKAPPGVAPCTLCIAYETCPRGPIYNAIQEAYPEDMGGCWVRKIRLLRDRGLTRANPGEYHWIYAEHSTLEES